MIALKALRTIFGAFVLLAIFALVGAGLYALYENEGGGTPFFVTFHDAKNLEPGSNVVYRDQVVGRVVAITSEGDLKVIEARLGTEHEVLLRERSRFWVQDPLGKSLLCFDNPLETGPLADSGTRFTGLEKRPDPDYLPPPMARKLESKPVWLCDVRVQASFAAGEGAVKDELRKSAGAVLKSENGAAWVLAPAWVRTFQGELKSRQDFVEFAGGETCTAELAATVGEFVILRVERTAWRGRHAPFWPDALKEKQGVAVVNFKGEFFSGEIRATTLESVGVMNGAFIVLVDGTNVAGFALPPVGDSGVRFVPVAAAVEELGKALR